MRAQLVAAVGCPDRAQQRQHLGQHLGVALAEVLEQAGGAFDVSEDERDGAVWQGTIGGDMTNEAGSSVSRRCSRQGGGRRPPSGSNKGGPLLAREVQCLSQQRDRVLARPPACPALQRADGLAAELSTCG